MMSARLPLLRAGTQRKLAGQEGWLQHYQRAVEMCPTYAPAHYNLGGLRAVLAAHPACERQSNLCSLMWPLLLPQCIATADVAA